MLTAVSFLADRGMPGGGMRHDDGRWWGLVGLSLVLVAAVLLTWLLARRRPAAAVAGTAAPAGTLPPSPTAAAEAILAERLARSEISPDDYRSLLNALRTGGQPPAAS